jgi:hypothetical protein
MISNFATRLSFVREFLLILEFAQERANSEVKQAKGTVRKEQSTS